MMSRTSISDGATAPHIFSTIPLENATYMISRIDPRSAYPRTFLLRCIHWPIHGRVNCPAMKGASNCSLMTRKMSKDRATQLAWSNQIDQATCRERVCQYLKHTVAAVSYKKQHNQKIQ